MHTGRTDLFLGINKENKDHSVDHRLVCKQVVTGASRSNARTKKGAASLRRLSPELGYFAICVGGLVSGHARHPPDVVV
jgi:hypothetical protein